MIIFNFQFHTKKPYPELTLRDTAYSFTGGSSIIAFQFYYYMSVRFFSLTDCLYIAVALQRCMMILLSYGFIGSRTTGFLVFFTLKAIPLARFSSVSLRRRL